MRFSFTGPAGSTPLNLTEQQTSKNLSYSFDEQTPPATKWSGPNWSANLGSKADSYLSMERPTQVALPPQAHAGHQEEGQQGLVGVCGSLRSTRGGERPRLQQPLQTGHVLRRRRPPVALLVNARSTAPPWRQVSRTGEGPPGEQEDRAGGGVSRLRSRASAQT